MDFRSMSLYANLIPQSLQPNIFVNSGNTPTPIGAAKTESSLGHLKASSFPGAFACCDPFDSQLLDC